MNLVRSLKHIVLLNHRSETSMATSEKTRISNSKIVRKITIFLIFRKILVTGSHLSLIWRLSNRKDKIVEI